MSNKYYDPGQQRAAKVSNLFARIARRYDFINDAQSFFLHRWWKRKMIRLAAPVASERALDLCCGTGDISFRLTRAGARVTGLDFSAAMLGVALRRMRSQAGSLRLERAEEISSPQFLQGDAQRLPFSDDSFEVISVAYGLRNLADWEKGLDEMWRVAKPGGRLLVLDFGKPDNGLWRWLYFTYLKCFVPMLGLVFAGDAHAYGYILESLQHFPAQEGVSRKLRELGGLDVRVHNFLCGAMSIVAGRKP